MHTRSDEIADGVFRLSAFIPDAGLAFNQFLLRAEEPLLFHTGYRALFPLVAEAVARITPLESLRWIAFGHVEGDECGAMNQLLAAAPGATVAHTAIGCMVQVNDLADRPPRPLGDGEVLDLGGKRVRNIDTPHVPHGWDAHVLYEETTGTLLCGDLFTAGGESEALTGDDLLEPAFTAEQMFKATALTPATAPAIRALAELAPTTLALMHGPSFRGDCAAQLRGLADGYEQMFRDASLAVA
jgi:flavorubredoxin